MGGAMVLLYASRACYNLAALALAPRSRLDAFDYDWYNVSDQVGIKHICRLPSSCGSGPQLAWVLSGGPIGTTADWHSLCLLTGGPGERPGEQRLPGVWPHPLCVGAAAHHPAGGLLPGTSAPTGPGEGQWRGAALAVPGLGSGGVGGQWGAEGSINCGSLP